MVGVALLALTRWAIAKVKKKLFKILNELQFWSVFIT